MKIGKKIKNMVGILSSMFLMMCVATSGHADGGKDLLGTALTGDVQATFGSNGKFWTVFILIDVILAAAAAVKTKNPMVFLSVAGIAFIPAFLIKALVFSGA